MYDVYLDKILLPCAPQKIDTKINNQNKTLSLINDGEINVLKQAGLTEISFSFLIPHIAYPFANYKNGFIEIEDFLNQLEKLKTSEASFQFIVVRNFDLFSTNLKVSIEDYTIKEDVKNGLDVDVSIKLKQYKAYGTKTIKLEAQKAFVANPPREIKNSPKPKTAQTYTVKKGDCLWNISKYFYGTGTLYTKIADANKSIIKKPNLIHPGDVLTIPV